MTEEEFLVRFRAPIVSPLFEGRTSTWRDGFRHEFGDR